MPTERSDKLVQEKISQLDSLPAGFQLNSSARWQEIEKALQPAKSNAIGWRYAAAIIICICLASVLWTTYRQQPIAIAKKESSKPRDRQPSQPAGLVADRQNPVVDATPHIPVLKKSKAISPVKRERPIADPLPQNTAIAQAPATVTPAIPGPDKIAFREPVVIATTKETKKTKRLPVIHLNELGPEQELLYTRAPLKKGQIPNESADDLPVPQNYKPWWQPKPKSITTVTVTDNH